MVDKRYEKIKLEIEKLGGVLLSKEYINNATPLEILCPICKTGIATKTWSNIQQRKNCLCKKCSYEKRAKERINKNENKIKEYIESLGGTLLEYNGHHKELKILCPKCNKPTYKQIQSIKYNDNVCCYECNKDIRINVRKTDIGLIRSFIEMLGGELVSDTFEYSTKNLIIKCDKCKREYERTWKYIKDNENVTCPRCSNVRSKGEKKIINILKDNDVKFETEKTFEDCKDISKLRFDFYIPDINTCIEFDGKQHFNENYCFGKKDTFKDIVRRDKIKNDYCKDNNINLLRINYKQFRNIEKILKENKIIPSQAS